jgi:hypothetical protein
VVGGTVGTRAGAPAGLLTGEPITGACTEPGTTLGVSEVMSLGINEDDISLGTEVGTKLSPIVFGSLVGSSVGVLVICNERRLITQPTPVL